MTQFPEERPRVFVIDVDGVMTDGKSYYTADGKVMKTFGPDDHDGICLLRDHLDIQFVSGDRRGFEISAARIARDMGFPLELVSSVRRADWIAERWPLDQTIYMGDGIFDDAVLRAVGYGIAPANGDTRARDAADFVTQRSGGDRAVAEACLHILDHFFNASADACTANTTAVAGGWTT
ncbi:MAG: HAD hydrolase family protein [Planctomycetota bacterium]